MSLIDIRHPHGMDAGAARSVVDEIANSLARKFATRHEWHDDTVSFKRPGVDGSIAVDAQEVRVRARLGMMLAPMRPVIEREIQRLLMERFAG